MKLLFVIPEYPPCSGGGIATFYRHLLPQLAQQGHQVHVVVGNAFTAHHSPYTADGVTVEFLDPCQVTANCRRFDRYHALPELQRHLAAAWTVWEQTQGGNGYDLVETTDWGLLFIPWIVSADSPPTIVQLHASIGQIDACDPRVDSLLQSTLVRLLEAELLALADELQTYSQANATVWRSLLGRSITYLPPALPVAVADPQPQVRERSPVGLVVGRIQYWKGPLVLCEAMRQLGDHAPAIDWVGRDTVYRESGQSLSAYLRATYPDVWGVTLRPIGSRSAQETAQLQAQARFLLVPSLWDVFNYTCAEGMAQAQTVLCSQGAGAADLITSHRNGLTFTAADPTALADALRRCMALRPAQQQQMGQAAQDTIRTRLCPVAIAQQRLHVYEQRMIKGRFTVRPHAWLEDAVTPQKCLTSPLAFLDQLPLRELAQYVLHRSVDKLRRSKLSPPGLLKPAFPR